VLACPNSPHTSLWVERSLEQTVVTPLDSRNLVAKPLIHRRKTKQVADLAELDSLPRSEEVTNHLRTDTEL